MSIVWSDVTTAFPNDAMLAAVGATEGQTYVEWIDEQVDDAILGTRADQVRILLSAHLATVVSSGGSGASGPVSSESVDGVSRSYAVTAAADGDDLSATSYGRRASALMRTSPNARLPRTF